MIVPKNLEGLIQKINKMIPRNYPDKDITRLDNLVYADSRYVENIRGRIIVIDNYSVKKKETKKEKIKRVAKEKMLASWKTYNQKTEKILEVKQICKPRHNINKFIKK